MEKKITFRKRKKNFRYTDPDSLKQHLSGRPAVPGSAKPASYYSRWKIIFSLLAAAILGAGFFSLFFL